MERVVLEALDLLQKMCDLGEHGKEFVEEYMSTPTCDDPDKYAYYVKKIWEIEHHPQFQQLPEEMRDRSLFFQKPQQILSTEDPAK